MSAGGHSGPGKADGLLDAWDLRAVLLHIAVRIRPFFDSVGPPAPGCCSLVHSAPCSPFTACGCPGSWAGRAM